MCNSASQFRYLIMRVTTFIQQVEPLENFGALLESLEFQAKMSADKLLREFDKLHPLIQRLLRDMYVCIYV